MPRSSLAHQPSEGELAACGRCSLLTFHLSTDDYSRSSCFPHGACRSPSSGTGSRSPRPRESPCGISIASIAAATRVGRLHASFALFTNLRRHTGLLVGHYNPRNEEMPSLPSEKVFLSVPLGHSRKPVITGELHQYCCIYSRLTPTPLRPPSALPPALGSTAERARAVRPHNTGWAASCTVCCRGGQ